MSTFLERKTYVVTLKNGIDYDDFYRDMENVTSGHPYVPDRIVDMLNENPLSERNTHYALSDGEAEILRQDPRVLAVEIPPQDRDDLIMSVDAIQGGNFNKVAGATSSDYKNWGLLRSIYDTNIYGTGTSDNGYNYNYHLDGTGVDVVIQDSGLHVTHPEFQDANGNSRVQEIDWYLAAGLWSSTTYSVNFSTSSQACISTNCNINANNNNAYTGFGSIGAAILIGAGDTSASYIGTGDDDSGRSYRIRFEGGNSSSNPTANNVLWEAKLLDNGWIQVLVLRHDSYNSGVWRVQNWSGVTLANMAYFNNSGLSGSGAVAQSLVLTTDNGQTWQVNGGINTTTNYYAALNSGTWTLTAGLATAGGQAGLTSRTISAADDSTVNINTPFSFPFVTNPGVGTSPQSVNHYRDYHGHGTHVAGIAAGKTFGWAKGARIFSLKVSGLEGTGDSGTGISTTDCFNVIKLWHRNKPVDPVTGRKRPTVVNMSWGYGVGASATPANGNYRGTTWITTSTAEAATTTLRWQNYGLTYGGNYRWSIRIPSIDADVEALANEGIIVCIAAGNNYDKIDSEEGRDYNNYVVYSGGTLYYHRGSSPHSSTNTFTVSCIDYDTYSSLERVAYFSTRGPGTTIWAPGRYIVSSCSDTNAIGGVTYYNNSNFKQANISGTSMASPQICGMAALYLQINPTAKFPEVLDFFTKNSKSLLYTTNTNTDYTSYTTSLMGAPNRIAYFPFGADVGIKTNATLK